MKATLFALFVALLMVGCATTKTKDDPKVEAKETSSANQPVDRPVTGLTDLDLNNLDLDQTLLDTNSTKKEDPVFEEISRKADEMRVRIGEPVTPFSEEKKRQEELKQAAIQKFDLLIALLPDENIVFEDNDANKTENGEAIED
jgi:uncharacterized protein YceK